jgi:hypothetical protein
MRMEFANNVGAVFRPPRMAVVPATQEHLPADREMHGVIESSVIQKLLFANHIGDFQDFLKNLNIEVKMTFLEMLLMSILFVI